MIQLSIVTVCWNSASTIERCIKSILPCLTNEIEYLIIDGASTDGTLNILNKYTSDYNFRVKSEKDSGIYNAMNKGAREAKGKYIWYINSDDEVYPGSIDYLISCLKSDSNKFDCYYGDMAYVRQVNGKRYEELKTASTDLELLKSNMSIWHPCFICRRDLLINQGGFDEKFKIAADWDLILRLYLQKCSFKYLPIVMARFYAGGASYTPPIKEKHLIRLKNEVAGTLDFDMISNYKDYLIQKILRILFSRILDKRHIKKSSIID
ncbi:glycosyltransferase family 2 protein [Heyndrickxia ginsengihumi]|uniref:glycosyltransferase family 2 protein n=1 Tax=Heyndrickxia ginsengihumi TaxID=363870 RepID=UPI003D25C86C